MGTGLEFAPGLYPRHLYTSVEILWLLLDVFEERGEWTFQDGIAPDPVRPSVLYSSLGCGIVGSRGNDPSAGSPTETLLRLHLPLNDEV